MIKTDEKRLKRKF